MAVLMPDFAAVRAEPLTLNELARNLHYSDLVSITDQMYTTLKEATGGASDTDIEFLPGDPYAGEGENGWTLAHITTHLTATAEESAAIGATLARGVAVSQRLRYEAPWEELTTASLVRERLEESQRMCRAFLDTWPGKSHLDLTYQIGPRFGPLNATGWHLIGLMHAEGHIEQLRETLRQARCAQEHAS